MIEKKCLYKALALQQTCVAVNTLSDTEAKQQRIKCLQKTAAAIEASKRFIGNDLQLVVLPEYFMTGYPISEGIQAWQQKASIDRNGKEYDLLCKIAMDNGVFISGNAYENDTHFPGLYFQTSFIVAPEGTVVLYYRRLNSMYAPTPHDVLDAYLDVYGADALFPVAKTFIGNLACIASEEILYPEIARCLALKGAEILLHSTSEIASPQLTQKDIAKRARAIENSCYVISANTAGVINTALPEMSADGGSQIINYEGNVLVQAGGGSSMVANTSIHIDALRAHRQRPGMGNFLSRQRNELFMDTYSKSVYPANTLIDKQAERSHFTNTQATVIQSLIDKSIITV